MAGGAANNQTWNTSVPSKIKVKLTVAYKKLGPGHTPPGPTTHYADVTVAKADAVEVQSGDDTPVANGQAVQLYYQVTSGGNDCGGYLAGTAQERLTNRVTLGVPQPDTGWMPAAPSPTFRIIAGDILDEHWENVPAIPWSGLVAGEEIASATQELRIVWSDNCGVLHFDQTLGSVEIVHRKVSDSDWQVEATVQ